jgi:hypothetical protein
MNDIKELSASFNLIREAHLNKVFTATEMANLLKEHHIPYAINLRYFTINGCLRCDSEHKYAFTDTPVYFKQLEAALKVARNTANQNVKKRITQSLDEVTCANFLKSRGWKLQKPITVYKEF